MKHRYIWNLTFVAFLALVLVCIAGSTSEAQRSTGAWTPMVIELDEIKWEMSDISIPSPKGMKSYRLINTRVDKVGFMETSNKVLRKILNTSKVGINREHIGHADDWHAWVDKNDPSSLIMQDSTNGNLIFSNRYTEFVSMTKLDDLPPPEEEAAEEICINFLAEMNLLPGDFSANAKLLRVGGLWGQDMKDGKVGAKILFLRTLHFGRVLDGFMVQGPGSKIVMEVGRGGAIVTMSKKWNPIQGKNLVLNPNLKIEGFRLDPKLKIREQGEIAPFEPTPASSIGGGGGSPLRIQDGYGFKAPAGLSEFFTPEEMKNLIMRELGNEWTSAESIVITNVELCYYDRSGNFIQPAYAVEAKIKTPEGSFNYLHHIAALRNAPEPIYLAVKAELPSFKDDRAPTETTQERFD